MNITDRLNDIGNWLQGEQDVRTNQVSKLDARLRECRDRIGELINVSCKEQDTRADMQHEINVLKRQIAELRVVVFENGTVVSMPRLEKAMKEMSACNAQDAHVAQDANMAM